MKIVSTCLRPICRFLRSVQTSNINGHYFPTCVCFHKPARVYSIKLSDSRTSKRTVEMNLTHLIKVLSNMFPPKYAESWDNTGMLIQPSHIDGIRAILLTNDLTMPVMREAISRRAGCIISYHPPIFHPLKKITQQTIKEQIVSLCLEHRIAVYSPHTSADSIIGGVNDWLLEPYGKLKHKRPVIPLVGGEEDGGDEQPGSGRLCELEYPLTLAQVVKKTKDHLHLTALRLAVAENERGKSMDDIPVSTVCAWAGSASGLTEVQADVIISGEMSHHDLLAAVARCTSVILCEHSNSERGYLSSRLKPALTTALAPGVVEILVSSTDRDPVEII